MSENKELLLGDAVKLEGGRLIYIGARPGMGTTSFVLELALECAQRQKRVCVLSLDMGTETLEHRLACLAGSVDMWALDKEREREKLEAGKAALSTTGIMSAGIREEDITKLLDQLEQERVDVVVLEDNRGRLCKRDVMARLNRICKEKQIVIIYTCHLPRGIEHRLFKKPRPKDVMAFPVLAETADTTIFLYRQAYYRPYDTGDKVLLTVMEKGQKTVAFVSLHWDRIHGRFE